jgi:tRNA(Ile)-lysidine synthase
MTELLDEVGKAIRDRCLLKRGERIVVAVSGGLDSVVLLRLLDELAPRQGWSLIVAHLNHGVRGRESDRDEAFVQATALRLGWPCVCGWVGRELRSRPRGVSLEMAAREARHRFLAEVAVQAGAPKIALAQHADDQIETVLLRLWRGASGEGLAGMRWLGPSPASADVQVVRPLLGQTRAALRLYARRATVAWREDQSNACEDITRNWLRREIIPRLRRRFGKGLAATVARTAELVGAEADLVSALARKWRASGRAPFEALHPALQRRVVTQQLIELGMEPGFELVEWLRAKTGVRRTIGPGRSLWRDAEGGVQVEQLGAVARFGRERCSVRLGGEAGRLAFGGLTVAWRIWVRAGRGHVRPSRRREHFDADRVGPAIALRHWQPGDRFCPIGLQVDAKLQDLFVNAQVPRDERHRRVIGVTAAGELFWVEGLRMAERFKITPQTQRWLEWEWSR